MGTGHFFSGQNFFVANYFTTALYMKANKIPRGTKTIRGYLIHQPARTTFQKFQYGVLL
jgi:hypothetical protein